MKKFINYLSKSIIQSFTQKIAITIVAIVLFILFWWTGHQKALQIISFAAVFCSSGYWLFALFRYDTVNFETGVRGHLSNSLRAMLVFLGGASLTAIILNVDINLHLSLFVSLVAYILTVGAVLHEMKNEIIKDS